MSETNDIAPPSFPIPPSTNNKQMKQSSNNNPIMQVATVAIGKCWWGGRGYAVSAWHEPEDIVCYCDCDGNWSHCDEGQLRDQQQLSSENCSAASGNSIGGLFTAYQRLDSLKFDSGQQFVAAVNEGEKQGSDIILGDRDIEITLRRVTEGSFKNVTDLLSKKGLKVSCQISELVRTFEEMTGPKLSGWIVVKKELTDEQLREEITSFAETLKIKGNIRTVMGQSQRSAPFLYEALVSERDLYMATGLNGLSHESIVAVVGMGNVGGIENLLQTNGWKFANLSCSKYY
jgi:hypothetical protein